jgi:hypothetical protein
MERLCTRRRSATVWPTSCVYMRAGSPALWRFLLHINTLSLSLYIYNNTRQSRPPMCGPRRLPLTGRISVRSVSVRYRECVCTLSASVLLCAAHRPLHERRRKCCLAQHAAGIGIARRETRGVARSRRPAVMRTYKGCLPPKGAALTMPTNATTTRKSSTCTISNISTSSVGVPKICAPQCAGAFI